MQTSLTRKRGLAQLLWEPPELHGIVSPPSTSVPTADELEIRSRGSGFGSYKNEDGTNSLWHGGNHKEQRAA